MSKVSISLLGTFRIGTPDGGPQPRLGQKEQGLLAVLAVSGGAPVSRQALADLLWSDRDEPRARDSLKHAVARLRDVLKDVPDAIFADRQNVKLNPQALDIDLCDFDRAIRDGIAEGSLEALELYRGQLLDGNGVRDPAFEDWLSTERRRLARSAEGLAAGIMNDALSRGDADAALLAAKRLREIDPFREDACRVIMRAAAELGNRAGSIREFEDLKAILSTELGVTPEPETSALYDEIRATPLRQIDPEVSPDTPSRPSIAVLAFEVPGGEDDQLSFADGIVEEIIAALSRVRWLFVISRSSSFAWRGEHPDVKEIGKSLGVRYVLTGSVRRAGDRLRIAGRLVETENGLLLWAETFEGDVHGVFELQDRVTERVVGAVAPRLEEAEIDRARSKPTSRLDAYDSYLRGLSALHLWQRDASYEAVEWFRKASMQDPEFAAAFELEARCYSQQKACGWLIDQQAAAEATRRAAEQAVAFGQDDAVALSTAGIGLAFVANDVAHGADLVARSLEVNPNLASAWRFSGWIHSWLGLPEIALDHLARASRLNPRDPDTAVMYAAMGYAHFIDGNYPEAARWAEKSIRNRPTYLIASCVLAASKAFLGDTDEARRVVKRIGEFDPEMSRSRLLEAYPVQRPEDRERWIEGLSRAGMPD